ncbi:hypothetical protein [Nocardia iowensis]|uniref:ESX-1 secretion-associated protein EspA/EspE-like domain-containing protein n=1 Tax=Nocardia iowensis TaxID=204891 RepID=A0ABX8RM17_NOCIO|nr:hypothetical protein [Nocardia iowensis]QXN90674.1 hypothetical protein KV110_35695 [Nocardia iowensis]
MGNEPSPVNPWPGLTERLREGELRLAPDAASDAANFAADALYAVTAVEAKLGDIEEHKGFSDNRHLDSGVALAKKFDAASRDLGQILIAHKKILSAMGEHFVTAGKLYRDTEFDSKAAFDQLRPGAESRAASYPPAPVPGKTPPPQDPPRPDAAGEATEAIEAENPYGHDLPWFSQAGLGMNPPLPASSAATWGWMAERLTTVFTKFADQLGEMEKKGAWTGKGIAGAITAANGYRDNVESLSSGMQLVASSLQYASSWLAETKAAMPTGPLPEVGSEAEEQLLQKAIAGFESSYIPGLEASSTAIPVLPKARSAPPDFTIQQTSTGEGSESDGSAEEESEKSSESESETSSDESGGSNSEDSSEDSRSGSGSGSSSDSKSGSGSDSKSGSETKSRVRSDSSADPRTGKQSSQDQLLSQARSLLQQGLQSIPQLPTTKSTNPALSPLLSSLLPDAHDPAKSGGPSTKPSGGLGGSAPAPRNLLDQASKLFPRATVTGAMPMSLAGVSGSTAPGIPGMAPPMGGVAPNDGRREHKRADYLISEEHMEEGLGGEPSSVRAVVQQ